MSQEIWVKKLPKIYYDSRTGNECIEIKGNFIFKSLYDHDRELVREVLEKVRSNLKENVLLTKNDKPEEAKLKLTKSYSIDLDILDQIQKEFEDE